VSTGGVEMPRESLRRRAGRGGLPRGALAVLLLSALVGAGCARERPVLYPNAQYERVGPQLAEADVEACLERADAHVGNTRPAASTARSTGIGAAIGAAMGAVVGAITGRPGRGTAIGAASGGTGGLARGVLRSRRNDPVFQRFVERCLQDRGYEPIGWR
jgi:uncharacterized protein YcfJ